MADLFYPETQPNRRATALGLDILPASFGEGWGAAFEDTLVRNPTSSAFRALRRQRYYEGNYVDEFGNEVTVPAGIPSAVLQPDEANLRYGIKGKLSFTVPTPEPVAEELRRLKVQEIERQDTMRRAGSGIGTALSAGLVGSLLDPLNVGLAFVPVVGEARFAALAARLGTTGARLTTGAVEGAVGAALLEPIVYGVAQQEQADYTAVDSLMNIVLGTAIGGGLHLGAGFIGDRIRGRAEASPIARTIDNLPVQDQAAILRTAVAQAVDGRPVNVVPVVDAATSASRPVTNGVRFEKVAEGTYIVRDGDVEIGRANVADSGEYLTSVRLDDQWQRMGIGTQLYDFIEADIGHKLNPSPTHQSPAAKSFWEKRSAGERISTVDAMQRAADLVGEEQFQRYVDDHLSQFDRTDMEPAEIAAEIEGVARNIVEGAYDVPALRQAARTAAEPHVEPADARAAASATERVADEAGPAKPVDDEITKITEEVTELESYFPENVEPSTAVKEATKEVSLYEKAWKAAASCLIRKA